MSGSITYCKKCNITYWANAEKCSKCGGDLEPTLRQVLALLKSEGNKDVPHT